MRLSERVANLPPYLFVEISRKIAVRKARGEEVISFAIGDPDIPTPPHIIERLCQTAREPVNHRYPESEGLPELRQAISRWYLNRFGISLDPDKEVLPLIGSKEGIGHVALCLLNPGDIALIPDPCYPVYPVSTMLAGGHAHYMPLLEKNGFLPDMGKIQAGVARKAKLMWLNYPNNPTGAVAGLDSFKKAVEFARKYDIAICHDGPYSEVNFDGYQPNSFLQAEGARDVAIEFHSFSKSYNMTGWRIGMAVGNAVLIDALRRIKSNLDSGIPQAIQYAAIAAMDGPQDCIREHNEIYQQRRDRIVETLNRIGLKASLPKASLYIWAQVPPGYNSTEFAAALLEETGVVVTPGLGYGKSGDNYVRLALTIPDDQVAKGLERLATWRDRKTGKAT
jgi:LL-diaminopimelate aminotransferase